MNKQKIRQYEARFGSSSTRSPEPLLDPRLGSITVLCRLHLSSEDVPDLLLLRACRTPPPLGPRRRLNSEAISDLPLLGVSPGHASTRRPPTPTPPRAPSRSSG